MSTTPGTPDAHPPVSIYNLMTRQLLALPLADREAAVTALRDKARAEYEAYARWVRALRRERAAQAKSQRQAARASGVSRAAVRKATGRK